MILRTFGWSFAVTALGMVGGFLYGGLTGLFLVLILCVLEISVSFDNAVVNAKVLERMNEFWQKIFLTVGVLIAVFGMRLVFPFLIVALTAKLGPIEAIDLALNDHHAYKEAMEGAYPLIAAFGGSFLLMLFLEWVFEDRDDKWLAWLEKPLARIGKLDQLAVIITGSLLAAVSTFAVPVGMNFSVLISGVLGIITYILVGGLGELFESDEDETAPTAGPNEVQKLAGKAAAMLFLYLEVLDATFSFDGVIGAFAISTDPIIIAIGLGVGAMYIRSITVFLVRKGTLSEYKFLEHGAHWAIGALAAFLLYGCSGHHAPEWLTGSLGAGLIIVAFATSILANNKKKSNEEPVEALETSAA